MTDRTVHPPKRPLRARLHILCKAALSAGLAVTVLSTPSTTLADNTPPSAKPLYETQKAKLWHFDFETDRDFNKKPDAWQRREGKDYPFYIQVQLDKGHHQSGDHSVYFEAERGKAEIYYINHYLKEEKDGDSINQVPATRYITIDPQAAYTISAYARQLHAPRTQGYVGMRFFDKDQKTIGEQISELKTFNTDWVTHSLRVKTVPKGAVSATVLLGMHSDDFKGGLWFDNVTLKREPRMTFESPDAIHSMVYPPDSPLHINANVGGLDAHTPYGLRVHVYNFDNEKIYTVKRDLVTDDKGLLSKPLSFPISESGFFRGEAQLLEKDTISATSEFFFTKLSYTTPDLGIDGKFALVSHPDIDPRIMGTLVASTDVDRVKLLLDINAISDVKDGLIDERYRPVLDAIAEKHRDALAALYDPTLLDTKSPSHRDDAHTAFIKSLIDDKDKRTKLDRYLTSYNDMFLSWQLGWENQREGSRSPQTIDWKDLPGLIAKYSFDADIRLPWNVSHYRPGEIPVWHPSLYYIPTQWTPKTLETFLMDTKGQPPYVGKTGLTIALQTGQHRHREQVADFAQKALVAKKEGIEDIQLFPLIHKHTAFLNNNLEAGPMVSALRTVTRLLNGAEFYGELIRGRHRMLFFEIHDQFVLGAWDPEGVSVDNIELGERVQRVDIMGNAIPTPTVRGKQQLTLNKVPTFYLGVSEPLVKTRMSFQIDTASLPLKLDMAYQDLNIQVKNYFSSTATLVIRPRFPIGWTVSPATTELNLNALGKPGDQGTLTFRVTPPIDTPPGDLPLSFDVDVDGDNKYNLDIKRLAAASSDIGQDIIIKPRREGREVYIEQRITNNHTRSLNLSAFVQLPNQPEISRDIVNLKVNQTKKLTYIFDADEVKDLTLRFGVREVNGTMFTNTSRTIR